MDDVLFGISLWPSNVAWPALREAGVAAERGGFDHLYAWDHFYALIGDQENPNLECTQVLAGWATATERIKIGSLVHGITYRNPAVLVKTITALDHLSGGRAIMGIGAAWMEPEHVAYGIKLGTKKTRSDRFEEGARIVRSMLRDRYTSFEGEHYTLKQALNEPRPIQMEMPVLIGGGGETRTLRTTALYADMWHGFGSPQDVRHKIEVLRGHCAKVRRDPGAILPLAGGWVVVRDRPDDVQAYLQQVADHHGIAAPVPRASGDPDTVAKALLEFWKAGARGFVMSGAHPFDLETVERIGREVRPRLTELIRAEQ
ncbi:MAG: TIGR03560 family F420-dependent LLM class oxidoreductase [Chloroflexi bacterium]|nr:TIGR03560 family F420-dependent LLM class oxidoreductase [Chloroflexota bacterium]